MSEDAARAIVWTILSIALVVWMIAVRFVARARRPSQPAANDRFEFGDTPQPTEAITGEVRIDCGARGLVERLARALSQPQVSQLGTVRVQLVDGATIAFAQSESSPTPATALVPKFSGLVHFEAAGENATLASYQLTVDRGDKWLRWAQLFLVLGLAAIGAMAAVMELYVIPNQSLAVRQQSIQAIQVCHLLWPPFVFAHRYRAGHATLVARVETLLGNLPHLV